MLKKLSKWQTVTTLATLFLLAASSCFGQQQPFPGGGGGGAPNGATIYSWLSPYNVKGTAKWVCDATFVNNSTTVTTPSTDRPFLSTDSFAVVWGSNASCNGANGQNFTTIVGSGVSATFVSTHQITLSTAATANCTPSGSDGCVLVWGPDDTTGVQNAWTDAANACGSLALPAGGIIIQSPITNSTTACPHSTGIFNFYGLSVYGQGPWTTMLLFSPAYSGSNPSFYITFDAGISNSNKSLHDFMLASFTSATAGMAGQSGMYVTFNSEVYNLVFDDFFPSNSQTFCALHASSIGDGVTNVHDIVMYPSGYYGICGGGTTTNIYSNNIQGNTYAISIPTPGSDRTQFHHNWIKHHTVSVDSLGSGANFRSDTDQFNNSNTGSCTVQSGGGSGTMYLRDTYAKNDANPGCAMLCQSTDTCSIDGSISTIIGTGATGINNQGTLTLRNATITGSVSLTNSGTTIIKEGNTFANGITNTGTLQVTEGEGGHNGACTGTVATGNNGLNLTSAACAVNVTGGSIMGRAGTVYAVYCTAGTGGNQAADACTLFKNGVATALTCSMNGITTCTDGASAHQVSYVASDRLQVVAVGGAGTTLANVTGLFVAP